MSEEIEKLFANLSTDELNRLITGRSVEEQRERDRRYEAASKLIGLPIAEWPSFNAVWDISSTSQRFAFDGMSREDFVDYYPRGLDLYFVSIKELDGKLCWYNARKPEEVWGVGSDQKAAGVLLDWIEGRSITPPVVARTNETDEICLHGGNHRLAVARANTELEVPILIDPKNFEFVLEHLPIFCRWPREGIE